MPSGWTEDDEEASLEDEKEAKAEAEMEEEATRAAEEGMVNRLVEPMGAKATPKEAKLEVEKLEVEKWEAAAMEQVEEGAGLVMEKEIEGVAAREVMLVEVNRYPG